MLFRSAEKRDQSRSWRATSSQTASVICLAEPPSTMRSTRVPIAGKDMRHDESRRSTSSSGPGESVGELVELVIVAEVQARHVDLVGRILPGLGFHSLSGLDGSDRRLHELTVRNSGA